MFLTGFAAFALTATASVVAADETGVGYTPLMEGRVSAAIVEIENNEQLDANDPARLINLGVAYAQQGRTAEARAMFEAAMRSENRAALETSEGEWKDSRHLARLALKMLDDGNLGSERIAAR